MNLKKCLIPLLSLALLAGCGSQVTSTYNPLPSTQNSQSNNESINSMTSDSSQSSRPSRSTSSKSYRPTSSSDWGEPTETITTVPVSNGSYGGALIDIAIGSYLEVGQSYTCSFVPSDCSNKAITASTTNEAIATVEIDPLAPGKLVVKPQKVGDCLLLIYSTELDCLVYRNVIKVRKTYSVDEIKEFCYSRVDKWKSTGIYGDYILSFLDKENLKGVINGQDDQEWTTLVFTLEYKTLFSYGDFRFYIFDIIVDPEESSSMRTFEEIWISPTGFNMLVYYSEGLLEQFFQSK